MDDDNGWQFMAQQQEEWEAEQALPEHKRDGWAELVYEHADMERERAREES